ncbi:MAG: DUF433 domain-containing protein [Desulfobacteraceae bacterium]|nr:DUF433 domain-containing protein [Desulfobacteraceae bacterium]
MLGFDRITFDSNIMGGRACIRGMRVTVSLIVNLFANDMSIDEIIKSYPYLEKEDVRQAIRYAYKVGQLSSGRAAELAGMPRVEFLLTLGRYKVFPFQDELNELEAQYA